MDIDYHRDPMRIMDEGAARCEPRRNREATEPATQLDGGATRRRLSRRPGGHGLGQQASPVPDSTGNADHAPIDRRADKTGKWPNRMKWMQFVDMDPSPARLAERAAGGQEFRETRSLHQHRSRQTAPRTPRPWMPRPARPSSPPPGRTASRVLPVRQQPGRKAIVMAQLACSRCCSLPRRPVQQRVVCVRPIDLCGDAVHRQLARAPSPRCISLRGPAAGERSTSRHV